MTPPFTRVFFAAALLIGCSSSGGAASTGDGGAGGSPETASAGSAGATSAPTLTGTFTLSLKDAVEATMTEAFSVAGGTVYDGAIPPVFPLVVEREEHDCQLLKPKIPFCSGGCGGDAACVDDETCAPYPKAQNVGIVRLDGLGAAPVTMGPFPPSFAYQSSALAYPPCVEGDAVRLQADGFRVQAACVAPLVVPNTDVLTVNRGQAVKLAWEPPTYPYLTRLLIRLDVSHHGGKKGEIECDVPDNGGFEIPASLVTALVDLGLAGYPTIVLTRVASASSMEQPDVKFVVSSGVEREVDTGITSCTDDTTCPAGQLCNTDKLTCE
jgi:hypothetical protein